jgi:hypothetical protein
MDKFIDFRVLLLFSLVRFNLDPEARLTAFKELNPKHQK